MIGSCSRLTLRRALLAALACFAAAVASLAGSPGIARADGFTCEGPVSIAVSGPYVSGLVQPAGAPVTLTVLGAGGLRIGGFGECDSEPYGDYMHFVWSDSDGGPADGSDASLGLLNPVTVSSSVAGSVTYNLQVHQYRCIGPCENGMSDDVDLGNDAVTVTYSTGPVLGSVTAPAWATTGEPVDLSATASGGLGVLGYLWRFGDGTAASGATVSHTFTKSGVYTWSVQVSDDAFINVVKSAQLVVYDPPVAAFTATPNPVDPQTPVHFDGSASSPGSSVFTKQEWDFGDGTGTSGSGLRVDHAYANPGDYDVRLTITDGEGRTASVTHTLAVRGATSGAAPGAAFTYSPATPLAGAPVSFDSTGSSDSDGSIVAYAWDFGDGSTSAEASPTHSFSTSGPHTVLLLVTDGDGLTGRVSHVVDVAAAPPVAAFTFSPGSPAANAPVSFDGSGSADADGTIAGYAWDFDDGATSTEHSPTHSFAGPGDYDVELTVTDNDGLTHSVTHTVTVGAALPTAAFTISPANPVVNRVVTFNAGGSTVPPGTTASYAWTFGDGSRATGVRPTHMYTKTGTFPVRLTVSDGAGHSATATRNVTVGHGAADLTVAVAGASPRAGQYTYTVTVKNLGPNPAAGVVLLNKLDPGETLLAAPTAPAALRCAGLPVGSTGTITCRAAPGATLASGKSWVVKFTVKLPPATRVPSVSETSSVSAINADPVARNNSATKTTLLRRA